MSAPHLTITDKTILKKFLNKFGIDPQKSGVDLLINSVGDAFSHVPYENLTKIIKADALLHPKSAMRYPDEVIGDYLRFGSGGTCFSLTAAITAVYCALGVDAYPILADRHYGADTHSAVIIFRDGRVSLIDPGYLLFIPVLLYNNESSIVDTGTNSIELKPIKNGEAVELYTTYRNNRKMRLTYKIAPADPGHFARVWESSFAWEMMSYPVLTRRTAGAQHYLQGKKLAVYTGENSSRTVFDDDNVRGEAIAATFGIDPQIIKKALEITKNG
ncbi:MAG: hypothetical protein FWE57_01075 [Chitinispirillia bacterium]|nr:hypothetical protein [Chitinispirillia bacterium]